MNRLRNGIVVGFLLLIIVAVALFWQSYNNKILPLYPTSTFPMFTQSDAYSLGGTSTSEMRINDDGTLILICEIKASDYSWPFCNITVELSTAQGDEIKGVDLSRFSAIKLNAKYVNTDYKGFRIQLRTFNPAYSKFDDLESWKFLTYEVAAESASDSYIIPFNALKVPNWWLAHNKTPVKYAVPELDNVMYFEIATGNAIPPGRYEIHIERLELLGNHFSDEELYFGLISLLSLAVLAYLINSVMEYRSTVIEQRERVLELSERNKYLASKNSSLKNKVNIDALTGVLNRHASEGILEHLQSGDAIILMDIDHFKMINDKHGHDVGDKVLLLFARAINNSIRSQDYFIRWGGEEFLCVCPGASAIEGELIANKFKALLAEQVWPESMVVTSSFGVAEMAYGETVEMLIKRADSALYQAKHQGRNRVVVS
ncbi:GGDEF domain-containing protein [Alteromonas sediminis]|uniref:diguanylate cyclase n=1 Tax=Alteromonas sediminis TaxID=2259342 RepID=A0A3N5XYA0_9ALTE|nr:GGDEF domain-containing protein [Alteromonas sediminis]RPJ65912.1 GGDEF domain-containing protein [Alteromonas sediminis]